MTEQEINNIPVFVEELKKMANAVYMACDAEVAADIALKTQKAIKLIARLDEENQKLIPVVAECREILSENNWRGDLQDDIGDILTPTLRSE